MIDVTKLVSPFPPGSPMRTIWEHVTTERAALPEGMAAMTIPSGETPASIPRLPKYDPTPDLVAASLAGGMIAAGGKVVTAEEAVGVFREVRGALARQ